MSITPEAPAKTLTQMVATRIRIAMAVEDIRQAELSRRMNKNEQWLSVRLRGKQPIDMNDLAMFARALNVGIHDLLPTPEEAAGAVADGLNGNLVPPQVPARKHVARPAGGRPIVHKRSDSVRPVSAVPLSKRRPVSVRPANRPVVQ